MITHAGLNCASGPVNAAQGAGKDAPVKGCAPSGASVAYNARLCTTMQNCAPQNSCTGVTFFAQRSAAKPLSPVRLLLMPLTSIRGKAFCHTYIVTLDLAIKRFPGRYLACRPVSVPATSAREHPSLPTGQGTLAPVPKYVGGAGQALARLCCQRVRGLPEVWSS